MVMVQNVPADLLNVAKISDYFAQFGSITNVQVKQDRNFAVVTFANELQAKMAVDEYEQSTGFGTGTAKPVMGNHAISLKFFYNFKAIEKARGKGQTGPIAAGSDAGGPYGTKAGMKGGKGMDGLDPTGGKGKGGAGAGGLVANKTLENP